MMINVWSINRYAHLIILKKHLQNVITYFFYLRVKFDVKVAIQYNDGKVILPNFGISTNRKYLYFNLADKIDKSGESRL